MGDATTDLTLESRPLVREANPGDVREAIANVTANDHLMRRRSGPLHGSVNAVRVGRVAMASITYSDALDISSRATGSRVLVVLPHERMHVKTGPLEWESDAPFAMSTEQCTEVTPAPGRGAFVAAVDSGHLAAAVEAATGRRFVDRLRLVPQGRPMALAAPELVRGAFSAAVRQLDAAVATPGIIDLMDAHLLSAIAVGVAPYLSSQLSEPGSPGRAYLDVAREYVEKHLAEPLTVGQIARACGISERQLHDAFRASLQVSPGQFVKERRLVRAHTLLTDPSVPAGATVAAIAKRVGVAHLGRFAKAYAERFGETPSSTLARTRTNTENDKHYQQA